jgi:hypothetical protein
LYVHSLSLSILLCLLAFMLQKLLFSGIQRTEYDSPLCRIPLHNGLSALPPLTSCSNPVPGSSDVSKHLAVVLSMHNVTVSSVDYVMSVTRPPTLTVEYPTFRTICFQGNISSSSNTSTRWYKENTVT